MNINDQFESKYLKSLDLQGRTVRAKISDVASEKVGDDFKIVVHFVGKQKGMICNRTNSMTLAEVWGPETDNWIGGNVEIFSMKVPFQGKLTDGLRLRPLGKVAPQQRPPSADPRSDWQAPPVSAPDRESYPAQAPAQQSSDQYGDVLDDSEIPF